MNFEVTKNVESDICKVLTSWLKLKRGLLRQLLPHTVISPVLMLTELNCSQMYTKCAEARLQFRTFIF